MTLPTLIQNYQKQVMLTALKKNYALLQQAVTALNAEYGVDRSVDLPFVGQVYGHQKVLRSEEFGTALANHLPVTWHGADYDLKGCFKDRASVRYGHNYSASEYFTNIYFTNSTNLASPHYVWQLSNGACIMLDYGRNWEFDDDPYNVRYFKIDVNGADKRPNKLGEDLFYFVFKPDGRVLPYGYNIDVPVKFFINACRGHNTSLYGIDGNCQYGAYVLMQSGWQFPDGYPWEETVKPSGI